LPINFSECFFELGKSVLRVVDITVVHGA
jgi:hypothetical protein